MIYFSLKVETIASEAKVVWEPWPFFPFPRSCPSMHRRRQQPCFRHATSFRAIVARDLTVIPSPPPSLQSAPPDFAIFARGITQPIAGSLGSVPGPVLFLVIIPAVPASHFPRARWGRPYMTSAKFSGFWTPSPPCPHLGLIYSTKFMQPPLLHLLLG